MNKFFTLFIALMIVYIILNRNELYRVFLDKPYGDTINSKRVADPFKKCSPESFGECKKTKMPHLSRY